MEQLTQLFDEILELLPRLDSDYTARVITQLETTRDELDIALVDVLLEVSDETI
jgi:hypothetical protein